MELAYFFKLDDPVFEYSGEDKKRDILAGNSGLWGSVYNFN